MYSCPIHTELRLTRPALLLDHLSSTKRIPQLRMMNRVFEFWMLPTAVVMYMTTSIYTAKNVSIVNTLTAVTRSWKCLTVTLLWFFTVVLVYNTIYILGFFLVMYNVGFYKYVNSREFLFNSISIFTFFFCPCVYKHCWVPSQHYICVAGKIL